MATISSAATGYRPSAPSSPHPVPGKARSVQAMALGSMVEYREARLGVEENEEEWREAILSQAPPSLADRKCRPCVEEGMLGSLALVHKSQQCPNVWLPISMPSHTHLTCITVTVSLSYSALSNNLVTTPVFHTWPQSHTPDTNCYETNLPRWPRPGCLHQAPKAQLTPGHRDHHTTLTRQVRQL
ncbi:hypothetical protein E2C01_081812 [Portunus trituberculatus]|uniref:Uncharacterized protein n=1 Tax=Portunus trituberculatus TaxID=210409 RepID=A0A5B7IZV8_PORTR|nr:hypothetical protein [Portunus trituberculatus]